MVAKEHESRIQELSSFGRRVLRERARLALEDPVGELEAVARLDYERALELHRKLAALDAAAGRMETTSRTGEAMDERMKKRSDRLAELLGVAPGRVSGRRPCPAHGSRGSTLSWRWSGDGQLLVNCFAGCSYREITSALGFDWKETE